MIGPSAADWVTFKLRRPLACFLSSSNFATKCCRFCPLARCQHHFSFTGNRTDVLSRLVRSCFRLKYFGETRSAVLVLFHLPQRANTLTTNCVASVPLDFALHTYASANDSQLVRTQNQGMGGTIRGK